MRQPELKIEEEIIEKTLKELEDEFTEKNYTRDVAIWSCATDVINHLNVTQEKDLIKKSITKAFMISNWTQRVYFIARSVTMTVMGALITLAVFWQLGTVNVIQDFLLGVASYLASLYITRLFDDRILKFSEKLLVYLESHTRLRDFIVSKF